MLEDETLSVDGRQYPIGYTFDNNGALSQQSYPTGDIVSFNPDGLGRARQAKEGTTFYADNVEYHFNGAIEQFNYGNGFSFNQTFNNRLLPERISSVNGTNTPLDLTYTYDNRGSITHIEDASSSNHDLTLGYDGLNRLISASGSWGSGSVDYDAMGNVRNKQLGARNISVNYDGDYRVTSSVDVGNMGGNTGTRNFQYDSRGNVTSVGGLNFSYDYANQPVTLSGSSSGSYSYDGNLKRVKSVVNGKTIYNVFSQPGKLVHIDNVSSSEETDYIEVNNQKIARIINGIPTYLHSDISGSPVAGTNSAGTVIFTERYTPFGITLDNNASNDDQAGYTGHIKDSDTGLTYMQARYYDPVIGRFYSNDPVWFTGEVDTFNRYSYVANNPYEYVDPTGMTKCIDKACTRSSIDTDVDGDGTTDVTFKNNNPNNPAPPNNLQTETAKLVENSIRDSGVDSVNINSTTGGVHGKDSNHPSGGAVDIDRVDGMPATSSNPAVKKLQDAIANQPNVRENFGPIRNEKTVATYDLVTGTRGRRTVQKPKAAAAHKTHIHTGGR